MIRVLDRIQQLHPREQRLEPLVRYAEGVDESLGVEDAERNSLEPKTAAVVCFFFAIYLLVVVSLLFVFVP